MKPTPPFITRLPAEPLLRRLGWDTPDIELAARLGIDRGRVRKMRQPNATINWIEADKLSIRVGYHPINIWPDLWAEQATPVQTTTKPALT